MVSILFTGIPRAGKTDLVQVTQELSRQQYETEVASISLGDIVAEGAKRLWGTTPEGVPLLDWSHQEALRWGAMPRAASQLWEIRDHTHVIVDTPMTMYTQNGIVPEAIFSADDIQQLNKAGGLDYVVTLIEDPNIVARRLANTRYPKSVEALLQWMAMEVSTTKRLYRQELSCESGLRRHLVIPRDHSDETLVKLLNDPSPTICYGLHPITSLHVREGDSEAIRQQKRRDNERINTFRDQLQEYIVLISPIVLADIGATHAEREHTVYRDINWFVANSDFTIAFFPGEYESEGVKEEMRATLRTGKPAILIHPSKDDEVFGVKPTLHYRSEEEFFEAIERSRENDDPTSEFLRRFLDPYQNVPRYAHLRPHAVAVDIYDPSTRKHILGLRPEGKPFAGKWMFPAGKKEQSETDFRSLYREVWHECGILLLDVEKGYKIHRVDYAQENAGGIKPQYVRIFRTEREKTEGKGIANNHVKGSEFIELGHFTRDEILAMGEDKIVPATLQYFQELQE